MTQYAIRSLQPRLLRSVLYTSHAGHTHSAEAWSRVAAAHHVSRNIQTLYSSLSILPPLSSSAAIWPRYRNSKIASSMRADSRKNVLAPRRRGAPPAAIAAVAAAPSSPKGVVPVRTAPVCVAVPPAPPSATEL
jgi:adenine/guanine phosphoribosyltransferase-like PRPP-binding protein